MKKQGRIILGILVFLLAVVVFMPQKVNAESGYKYIRFGEAHNLWDKTQKEYKPSRRIKYGKNYYWAVIVKNDYSNGSGYAIYKIDYYYSKSKTGAGTKLFSSYETFGGENDTLEFYTNGTYIIKTESSIKNANISVRRYNMKGKNKKTIQTFKAGSSSDVGKGYDSSCSVSIIKIYGGKVYAAYQPSGLGPQVKVVSFPIKSKKTAKTLKKTYCYFSPSSSKLIGFVGDDGTTIYNLKTGKTKKITSSRAVYLGKYKTKEYYYTTKDGKATIYSTNTAWNKRTKVGKISTPAQLFMKGKLVYYYVFNDDYTESDFTYDVIKKSKKEITLDKYNEDLVKYYDRELIKARYTYW